MPGKKHGAREPLPIPNKVCYHLAQMKESLTRRMTKAVAETLRLKQQSHGCCPSCRLVQPLATSCRLGCEQAPRRIVSGDEKFFEAIPWALEVIPENPKKLRDTRLTIGFLGYLAAFIGLLWLLPMDLYGVAIAGASMVPIGVALTPRIKRLPPTTTAVLSRATNVPQLPAPPDEASEGEVLSVGKQVKSFLDGSKCLACELLGVNAKGKIVVRARRSCSFQVEVLSGGIVVRGDIELGAEAKTTSEELPSKVQASLGLKSADLADVEWRERILLEGMWVRVYGVPKKMSVPELASYRDTFADVLESDTGTLVEIVSD